MSPERENTDTAHELLIGLAPACVEPSARDSLRASGSRRLCTAAVVGVALLGAAAAVCGTSVTRADKRVRTKHTAFVIKADKSVDNDTTSASDAARSAESQPVEKHGSKGTTAAPSASNATEAEKIALAKAAGAYAKANSAYGSLKALGVAHPKAVSLPGAPTVESQAGSEAVEFGTHGGPKAVAGTKLVSAGLDDLGDLVNPHYPEPIPDQDYALENPPITIYMYRAQSDKDYPMRNVNLGDLAGVMWYLHNEIIGFPDKNYRIRHFNITRIIRFKGTIQNPPEWYHANRRVFGPYAAYNAGKCSSDGCDQYSRYGAVVGCQLAAKDIAMYSSSFQTSATGGNSPMWFSLPGPCPTHEYGAKDEECIAASPGGDCGVGKDQFGNLKVVTGAKDCSYQLAWHGEVRLDEFLPTDDFGQPQNLRQFMDAGGIEYSKDTDYGIGDDFWDGIHDPDRGQNRMDAVIAKFAEKYPTMPLSMQESSVVC